LREYPRPIDSASRWSLIGALFSIVNDPKANASARISAANSLLDRGHGRPPQAVAVKTESNNDTFLRLWRYLTVGGWKRLRMSPTRPSPRVSENQITASRFRELRSERLGRQAAATYQGCTMARMRIVGRENLRTEPVRRSRISAARSVYGADRRFSQPCRRLLHLVKRNV
jgi:hypothetical protein